MLHVRIDVAECIVAGVPTFVERGVLGPTCLHPSRGFYLLQATIPQARPERYVAFVAGRDELAFLYLPLNRVVREGFPARTLALTIEVLSPGSVRHDRVTKRAGYQRHVPEYWVVDVEAGIIERWKAGDLRPEILTERLVWMPGGASEPFTFGLVEFFSSVRGGA